MQAHVPYLFTVFSVRFVHSCLFSSPLVKLTLACSHTNTMTRFFLFCQLVLATFFNIVLTSAQDCYMPNGHDRNARDGGSPNYWSCNITVPGGSGHSMCCSQTNTCQPNGLCMDNGGNYWRESCTDSTWRDPACLQLYVTDDYGEFHGRLPESLCPQQADKEFSEPRQPKVENK